mmetsp:Transcript_43367/g.70366  ORF Transcript_43367/g.70366 Transcript_43367/m.70366 type:complete len:528 (+) Transcript_43367:87-1670(+)|eukprot:CAMPEP_0184653114 /NCGR_PEP_ID=MMETSP0308-20130426/10852_1 /TAXON_ID=38269 /ORGANISM="Gloeochaete witrockiana, Strain SAG 46.84" /LENGTH=527 /DNA_ID=CAMNT_0027088417 /DNA_START=79 /DNA_END=1662 /DNA_ORIENTATION=-
MVVLSAAVSTKAGKTLLARQFVELSRIRIEGLLAAFPKLVGSDSKQHTYVETENVRYVYQPMENLYLLLITTKSSNIMEDLETLRLLAKVVSENTAAAKETDSEGQIGEYQSALDEQAITENAFEIIFAFDEVISLGYRENITLQQIRTNLEMESHEEKLHNMIRQSKINDAKEEMKRKVEQIDKAKAEQTRMMKGMGPGNGRGFGSGSMQHEPSIDRERSEQPAFRETIAQKPVSSAPKPSGKGMQLGKSSGKTNELMQALKDEGEIEEPEQVVFNTVKKTSEVITDPVHLTVDEKLVVHMDRDGGVENVEVKGDLSLVVRDSDFALLKVQIKTGENKNYQFKAHPNINKTLFTDESILALKDQSRPFPTGSALGILKWRYQSKDVSAVPLTINCWPSSSGGVTFVNIEYELTAKTQLGDVNIVIPVPGNDSPKVTSVDGVHRFDGRNGKMIWHIDMIDNSNKTGAMEFTVPGTPDPSNFFPVQVSFISSKTFCDLEVQNVLTTTDGKPVKYSKVVGMSVEEFTIA